MTKDQLELFSFQIDEKMFEHEKIFYMTLPQSWRDFIGKDKNKYRLKVKPSNLSKKLQALFPSIFHISWKKDEPWLYSDKEINPHIIKLICLNWLAYENTRSTEELPINVQNISLVWKCGKMRDLSWKKDYWKYNWIPGLMAAKFANQTHYITIEDGYNGNLTFHHVYFNGKHECMSEPIRRKENGGYFSYVIRFSLKNRAGLPEPSIINVSFGIRRFLQRGIYKNSDINNRRKGSILVSISNPFFVEKVFANSYVQLKFKKTKNGEITWADGVDKLFADVLQVPFQPNDIVNNPNSYYKGDNFSALVVYSDLVFESKYNLSKVIGGIGLPEKWALFDYLKSIFSELNPLNTCENILSKNKDSLGKNVLPLQHAYSPDTKICFEFWTSKELYDQAIKTYLKETILLQNSDGTYRLNAEPALDVDILFKDSTMLASALEPTNIEKAYHHRVRWIHKVIGPIEEQSQLTMALVEIDKKDKYDEKTDPKSANRIGLANTNRISQFIYPFEKDESENQKKSRLINSFYDLLADHGFLPARVKKLNEEKELIGFRLIKGIHKEKQKDVYLPVVTRIYKNDVKVRLFDRNDWLTVRDALLSVSKNQKFIDFNSQDDTEKYQSFFKRAVCNCLDSSTADFVIFLDAKLRSQKWVELMNPNLDFRHFPFHLEHPEAEKRIKVVRVSTEDDVSQYRINPNGNIEVNRNQGLFKDNSSDIYYSVGARPDTVQVKKSSQKYNNPLKPIRHQRLVEIIPLGTGDEKERDQLAKLGHNLRKLNIAYSFHTNLPYPLDIMKSLKKYIADFTEDGTLNNDPDAFEEWVYVGEDEQLVFLFE